MPFELPLFLAATLTLNLTPGPDMLFVIARSAAAGRSAGIASAFGIAAGLYPAHARRALRAGVAPGCGPRRHAAVQYGGAAYLMVLGYRTLRSKGVDSTSERDAAMSLGRTLAQGLTTNVLNPKVALFFLAFLPQFVDRKSGDVAFQIVALGILFNVSGTIVNVAVALVASLGVGTASCPGCEPWTSPGVRLAQTYRSVSVLSSASR